MTVTEPDPNSAPQGDPPDPNAITVPVAPVPEGQPPRQPRSGEPPQVFSQEDIERIRQEERARYMKEMERADALDAEVARLKAIEDERAKAEAQAQRAAEKAKKKAEEEEMDMRQIMERRDQEWEQRLAEEKAEREKAFAMLEQERRHASLQTYLAQRMAEVGDEISPELRDLVAGNTEQEIDASIAVLVQKSELIHNNVVNGIRTVNAQRQTVGVTAPPVGPLDQQQSTRTYTADELKAMTPEEYAAQRDDLLRAASQSRRGQ